MKINELTIYLKKKNLCQIVMLHHGHYTIVIICTSLMNVMVFLLDGNRSARQEQSQLCDLLKAFYYIESSNNQLFSSENPYFPLCGRNML